MEFSYKLSGTIYALLLSDLVPGDVRKIAPAYLEDATREGDAYIFTGTEDLMALLILPRLSARDAADTSQWPVTRQDLREAASQIDALLDA